MLENKKNRKRMIEAFTWAFLYGAKAFFIHG